MLSTDTWLKAICALQINAVAFGTFVVTILTIPALTVHAAILIPVAIAASIVISPIIAWWIAPRMRLRNWGKRRWNQGDIISG
ncbi:hypothetical protein HDIA_1816 [Hartmannibacter diazotrophicus]|uniref:Uncharacterized protein n=1 Tax=Hartmannibacter diazotrophicus TaxID=1482074 RepID=A0A2C9D4V5_9HYPH|nr:hypothetical protein [Hartmannibacter diazotrophicus]SON55357.1 hypothetical protein HDIA_1816 [Hartmannibacter diazotrophicus]